MSFKKTSIPSTQSVAGEQGRILSALKDNIEIITGVKGGEVQRLSPTATLPDVVAKINELINRLNASGG